MAWRFYTSLGAEKVTNGSIEDRGTTFPAAPFDGQEYTYVADATGGYLWRFKYNSGSASSLKWEFCGGDEFYSGVAGNMATTSLSMVSLTGGPTITVARSGDYIVEFGLFSQATAFSSAYDSFAAMFIVSGAAVTSNSHFTHTAAFAGGNIGMKGRTPLTAGQTLELRVALGSSGGTNTFSAGWMTARPIRVI